MSKSFAHRVMIGLLLLPLAFACRGNSQHYDDAESALGRPTGHNPATAGMESLRGQKTCPISGEKLGSHGTPVPTTVKGEVVYVCCSACLEKVRSDPDGCLAKVKAERSAPTRETPIVAASFQRLPYNGQRTCPVMNIALDPDGKARAVNVKGETIFVCCGKCAMAVRMHPDKYLAKVRAEREATYTEQMQKASNVRPAMAAQKVPEPDPIPSAGPGDGSGHILEQGAHSARESDSTDPSDPNHKVHMLSGPP